MAKALDAVVLTKTKNSITVLLETSTKVEVPVSKLAGKITDLKLGQTVSVLYDYTEMKIRQVKAGFNVNSEWPVDPHSEEDSLTFDIGEYPHT